MAVQGGDEAEYAEAVGGLRSQAHFSKNTRDEGIIMNTSYGSNLESDSILDLLREFHSEAENILAHLSEIDLECQENTEHATN